MDDEIKVEVAYATPQQQLIIPFFVPPGTTVEAAVLQSGILDKFPEIDFAESKVGVFGKAVKKTDKLHEGDRVEIYRKLIADAKESRRRRAEKGS